MYAIVEIAGQQFRVEQDQKIFVHRLDEKEGSNVGFDRVLLIDNGKDVLIGRPVLEGARINARVLSHPKGDKVRVFKKKRRKGYKVLKGHRQYLTEVVIEEIIEKGASKAPAAKKDADKSGSTAQAAEKPAARQKEPTVKKAPAAKKSAQPKKAVPKKKPAQKKATPAAGAATTRKSSAKKPAASKTAAAGKETKNKTTTPGKSPKKTAGKTGAKNK